MKKLDKKTEQFLLRNLCTRIEEIQKFFIFIYFLCMQGHQCRTKLKRNEFLLLKFMISFFFLLFCHHTLTLKFMISFFFLLFFIIHWLWNSWFPFSFCFFIIHWLWNSWFPSMTTEYHYFWHFQNVVFFFKSTEVTGDIKNFVQI